VTSASSIYRLEEAARNERLLRSAPIVATTTSRRHDMQIRHAGSQPSARAPAEYFTGTVRIDPLFPATDPSRVAGNHVTFEPGARTAWHTHPFGQALIVTSGLGRVQRWGGPIEDIRPGDVVSFGPGEKHWHGASAATAMSHIAIQESLDGSPVTWMERVTDEQYGEPAVKGA
jgi:quercetin dioxygenase-like cupin family protein